MHFVLTVVLAIVLALFVCAFRIQRRRETFEQRFPPTCDAEFLARCKPGVDAKIALTVRRIVADYFDVEYERIYPSTRFIQDLDAD